MIVRMLLQGYGTFIEMSSTAVLLKTPEACILFDTGAREHRQELLHALREQGLEPNDIDVVALTHLHMDHCENLDLFGKAALFCSAVEYDWATAMVAKLSNRSTDVKDIVADYLFMSRGVPASLLNRLVRFFKEDKALEKLVTMPQADLNELVSQGVQVLETPGHTRGHLSFCIGASGSADKHIITGDAILNQEFFHRLDFRALFTRDEKKALESKKHLKTFHGLFYPGHGGVFYISNESEYGVVLEPCQKSI